MFEPRTSWISGTVTPPWSATRILLEREDAMPGAWRRERYWVDLQARIMMSAPSMVVAVSWTRIWMSSLLFESRDWRRVLLSSVLTETRNLRFRESSWLSLWSMGVPSFPERYQYRPQVVHHF